MVSTPRSNDMVKPQVCSLNFFLISLDDEFVFLLLLFALTLIKAIFKLKQETLYVVLQHHFLQLSQWYLNFVLDLSPRTVESGCAILATLHSSSQQFKPICFYPNTRKPASFG